MKVIILLISCFIFITAQQSIGLSKPDQISIIKNYTIPDFQTTRLYLRGQSRYDDTENHIRSYERKYISTYANSYLNIYGKNIFDSENLYYYINLNSGLSLNSDSYENVDYGDNNKSVNEDDSYSIQYGLTFNSRYYPIKENVFLKGSLHHFESNSKGDIKYIFNDQTVKNEFEQDKLTSNFALGLGFGKVRNVSHVISALRLSERLNELLEIELSDDEVLNVAQEISKISSISSIFDRSKKVFWKNIFKSIDSDISALELSDVFFLEEALLYDVYPKKEGYLIGIDYSNNFDRDKYYRDGTKEDFVSRASETITIYGDYYNNLNLEFMILASFNYEMSIPKKDYDTFSVSEFNPEIGVVYQIYDRLAVYSELSYLSLNSKINDFKFESSRRSINTEFTYYIENSLSFSFSHRYSDYYVDNKFVEYHHDYNIKIIYDLFRDYQ